MKKYTIEEMKLAFETGRNFQLTGEDNFQELITKLNEALILPVVVRQSEQLKAFSEYIQERMWEDGEKDLSEFVDDFLSL